MSEQPQPFSPDDPRLTAYLLGEMAAEEHKAFEAELESHPEAQAHLEGLRETSSLLSEALDHEPAPALSASQRSTILSAAAEAHPPSLKENPVMKNRRGTWAILAALTALAGVVVVLINWPNTTPDETLALNEASQRVEAETSADRMIERKYGEVHPTMPFADSSIDDLNVVAADPTSSVSSSVPGRPQTEQLREREAAIQAYSSKLSAAKSRELASQQEALARKNIALQERIAAGQKAMNFRYAPKAPPATNPLPVSAGAVPGLVPGANSSVKGAAAPGEVILNKRVTVAATSSRPGEGRPGDKPRGLAQNAWKDVGLKADFAGEEDAEAGNESYAPIFENDFVIPRGEQALSTFSIDVDTASYSNMRRFIKHGQRPPIDSVRIEELVNYFHYDYAPPINGDPFSVHTEVAICPWKPEHHLVRFGLKGKEIAKDQRPLSNLVFLVDVSGSMSSQNKLPLVKKALTMLVGEMNENDRISLVTYASNAAVRLPSTSGEHRSDIISAIQNLKAGGSTNGEGGIHLAYTQAIENFIEDGSNRVILCTDGDFNVGVSGDEDLASMIEDKAKKSSVFLSVFGFGMGNFKDSKLEKLSGKGNGNYAYIDNEREARKVFVEELTGTLYTIAKDVKIQVEFNPAHVGAYRLIGYENRILAAQDFNDDAKDAGEIGAGHTVTALYEVIPAGIMPAVAEDIDRLKYQPVAEAKNVKPSPDLLMLKLRYKQPDEGISVKREFPVKAPGKQRTEPTIQTEWQAAVAAFGMVLRNSKHKGQADLRLVKELAMGSRGPDPSGRRREFVDLVLTAERLAGGGQPVAAPQAASKEEAQKTASVQGKYKNLLQTVAAPQDLQTYGAFNDYGYWEGKSYLNQDDLPKAHWVYVYPNWYLWGESTTK